MSTQLWSVWVNSFHINVKSNFRLAKISTPCQEMSTGMAGRGIDVIGLLLPHQEGLDPIQGDLAQGGLGDLAQGGSRRSRSRGSRRSQGRSSSSRLSKYVLRVPS